MKSPSHYIILKKHDSPLSANLTEKKVSQSTILFEVRPTSQPPRGVKEFVTYHNFYFISYCTAWFKFSHYEITISLNYFQKTRLTPSANLTEKKCGEKLKLYHFRYT